MMSTMSLLEQIDGDLKEAMRNRDEPTKLALRSVKTALIEAEKEGSESHTLSAEAVSAVIQRAAKQRRDAIAEFERAGRTDLVAKEQAELTVLERYLPKQMDESEVEAVVREVIAETGAQSPRDMSKVMPLAIERSAGRADGRMVSQVARRLLS